MKIFAQKDILFFISTSWYLASLQLILFVSKQEIRSCVCCACYRHRYGGGGGVFVAKAYGEIFRPFANCKLTIAIRKLA